MKDTIDRIMQRTQSYWYEDGFVEIVLGLLFAMVGVLLFLQEQVPMGSPLILLTVLAMIVIVFGSSVLVQSAVQNLKQRITYPRTGFVKYQTGEKSRGRWLIPAFALLLVALSILFPPLNRISIFEGLLMGAVLCFLGYRSGVWRFYLLAAVSTLVGVIASLVSSGDGLESAIFFGLFGVALAISGGLSLRAYLSHNPEVE